MARVKENWILKFHSQKRSIAEICYITGYSQTEVWKVINDDRQEKRRLLEIAMSNPIDEDCWLYTE